MATGSSELNKWIQAALGLRVPGAHEGEVDPIVAALKRMDLLAVDGLKPLRVRVLGNVTTDYLADHLKLMLLRSGFGASVNAGQYGGLVRGLLGDVDLGPENCDACFLILDHRDIQFPPPIGSTAEEARALVQREADFWISLIERSRVPTVVMGFDMPPHRILDEQDGLAPGGLGWHVRSINQQLASRLPATTAIVDAEALQFRVGAAKWLDQRLYHLCKQPYSMDALPEIAHTLVAALAGLLGRARKVLVLDLDNTLWGGVVGDDGLQGIELGQETADGEAFANFQKYVRQLAGRGVILAVCSKNREEVARAPFREHSGMVLKEEDIACFVANFEDKASNLRHIARTLNLGLDSLVFVDDNPVERSLVRSELPEVMVVEMPEDPAHYVHALDSAKAFPLRALTREDLGRGASYRTIAALQEASAESGTDMDRFLSGLQPVAHVEAVDASTVDRIVQLIRKTNQFKLNLSIFSEAEILAGARDVVAIRLADRLQDYGIVAIAVTVPGNGILRVANWVMSCRVFGRRLENVMLETLRTNARSHGCTMIECVHTPTEKNVILPPILRQLGFESTGESAPWRRSAEGADPQPHYMTIIDRRLK